MSAPKIGQIVSYYQPENEKPYNGHFCHPAMVTMVWNSACVNVKVFFDCGPVEDRTSVPYNPDGTTGYPHYQP